MLPSLNTRMIRNHKVRAQHSKLKMLTCYDFQMAQILSELPLDIILVGDSLGNIILGEESTTAVELETMITFSKAVKKGAPNKFIVADLPFEVLSSFDFASKSALKLFQKSSIEAIKIEGAYHFQKTLITHLTSIGIPVMGHIGLRPQAVHEQGGYFKHGKDPESAHELIKEALALQKSGVFALVLECVAEETAKIITDELQIPTIGIGSGKSVDGHVHVINDLFKMGPGKLPKHNPEVLVDLYSLRKEKLEIFLKNYS